MEYTICSPLSQQGSRAFSAVDEFNWVRKVEYRDRMTPHPQESSKSLLRRTVSLLYVQATASKPRRAVSVLLLVWAFVDAVLTAIDMPTVPIKVFGFIQSLGLSVLFIALVMLTWDSIARWRQRVNHQPEPTTMDVIDKLKTEL